MTRSDPNAYLRRYRRMLLDMHIGDWDEGFLARYDAKELVRCYELAGVNAVMLYCKSHVGLAYWPTTVAKKHPAIEGDAVGDVLRLLQERDILVCGYTSISFDKYAVETNPDWSVVPPEGAAAGWPRWSVVCLNERAYLDYEKAMLTELLETYRFDAFFLDMAFWPCICVCDRCRDRFAAEVGGEIPANIDWESPDWVRFQEARERWADEFIQELIAHARGLTDVPVYHNFAVSFWGWLGGHPLRAYRNDSFLGADLTGGRDEQLFAIKLMRATSPNLPGEYMTPRAPTLYDHTSIKPEREMTLQALGAVALHSAVLFIDAIDPDGRVDPDLYDQIGRINRLVESHELSLGGEHVEDVGVYFSSEACVDLRSNGTPLAGAGSGSSAHLESAVGAIRVFQEHHIAAGVVTYRQLDKLSRYPVLILPDLSRITAEEVAAFREYVVGGGRLYASGRTSLLGTDGVRHDDFLLSDLFGAHRVGEEAGGEIYVLPATEEMARAIAPQKHLGWSNAEPGEKPRIGAGSPRISVDARATSLATLSLPYAYPDFGSHTDRRWASIYSSPPWEQTPHPMIVENGFGAGRSVYSVVPLERHRLVPGRALFVEVVRRLLGDDARLTGDAHPSVWIEAFHQPEAQRFLVNLLNYPTDLDPIPMEATFTLTLPKDARPVRVVRARDGGAVTFERNGGRVRATVTVELLEALTIEYAT